MAEEHPGQPVRGDSRRRVLRTPVAILAIGAVLAVSAVAVRAFASDNKSKGCSNGITLTIAVAPDIQPAVDDAATRWAGTNPKVNGQCVKVDVRSAQPADVARALAERAGAKLPGAAVTGTAEATPDAGPQTVIEGQADKPATGKGAASTGATVSSGVPAVWVADSSAWIARTRAVARDAFTGETPSIALTPVVLAMPDAFAAATLAGKPRLTGAELTALMKKVGKDGVTFSVADPNRDSAGLAGAMVLREVLAPTPDKAGTVVSAYRSVSVAPTTADLVKQIKAKSVVAVTEQTVLHVDADGPQTVLTAVPLDQPLTMDYPIAVTSGNSAAITRAAERFRTALTSGEYRNILSREGFRSPDGTPGGDFQAEHGVTAEPVKPNPLKDEAEAGEVRGYWAAAKVPSRVLTLIDTTSSMKQPAKATRIDAVRKAAVGGAALFNDASELGVWTFGASTKEIAPVAALTAGQRSKLTSAVNGVTPGASDTCALYDAVLNAYRTMRNAYRAGQPNTVVVFTDGSNNAKSGLTSEQLGDELRKGDDQTRPVRLVLIGVGPEANIDELKTIAGYVGGKAVAVQDLAQLNTAYVQGLLGG